MEYTVPDIMMALIRCEICGEEFPSKQVGALTEQQRCELYELSKKHDLAHIVASCLLSRGILSDGDLKNAFSKEQMTAVFRHAQIRHELSRVCRALAADGIEYMPLKGSVIRKFYPKPEFRTSCDIDIFLHPEDVERASSVMTEKLGYKFKMLFFHSQQFDLLFQSFVPIKIWRIHHFFNFFFIVIISFSISLSKDLLFPK